MSFSPTAAALPATSTINMHDAIQLSKLRLLLMVGIVTASGYALGAGDRFAWLPLFGVVLGMLGVGAAGSAFNQILEIEIDSRMPRTAERPIPSGRVAPNHALAFGAWCGCLGACAMLWTAGPLATALALFAFVLYVAVYTPLKSRTTWNTWVGAIPGALPVAVGYAAGGGDPRAIWLPALVLFGLIFLWQIPHFFAIAWLYRAQYAAAGLRMLPCSDPSGKLTGDHAVLHALALLLLSLAPWGLGMSGPISALVGGFFSLLYLLASIRFRLRRDDPSARLLLRSSLLYLPALFLALVGDAAR
ncbi:MAG: protoheme IX farnesyltransferase [Planctomycetes bacterium]|nr:protoheme IX farnesyltransferase [Planctomycetota bacterium]